MEKPLELNMMIIRKQMSVLVFLTSAFLSTWTTLGDTAEILKGQRLDIGYAPVTGNRIPLWVAEDIGFFARQDLATRLIYLASSAQGIPALVSGQIPIFSGSPETAAQAAANGADLVIVASASPTPYKLLAQPDVKTVAELRGKEIGIDRIGGSSYYATRRMLQKLGIQPGSVEFLQVAGGGAQRVRRT
jgi:ABC-type nitrate/sulfonate/bicarbonate transport system substrate-binding protein